MQVIWYLLITGAPECFECISRGGDGQVDLTEMKHWPACTLSEKRVLYSFGNTQRNSPYPSPMHYSIVVVPISHPYEILRSETPLLPISAKKYFDNETSGYVRCSE